MASIKAKENFNVGLEARASRPMLGSDRDSDESIGVVIRKTIYNGKLLESELEQAEARVKSRAARLRSLYREGERAIKNAQQTVSSMNKAIELAKENAQVTREETATKRQLVIGGSTLIVYCLAKQDCTKRRHRLLILQKTQGRARNCKLSWLFISRVRFR